MSDRVRRAIRLLLLAVCAGSLAMFLWQQVQNRQGRETYEQALSIAQGQQRPLETEPAPREEPLPTQPAEEARTGVWIPAPMEEDENVKALEAIDIAALQQVNPDVIGWISIPNSQIHYPILQGEDNDFYLNHTWEKSPNTVGSVFMEHQLNPDFQNFNSILYAHNMNDGSMFAQVSNYASSWYYEHFPYIYIVLPDAILRYQVFACYQAPVESPVYGISFRQRETREKFLAYALEQALVDTGIQPEISDRILTLSTCTGGGYDRRWVVQGRMPMVKVYE